MTRAKWEFGCRFGLVMGIPFGAWGYTLGGWPFVLLGAFVMFVLTVALYVSAVVKELR